MGKANHAKINTFMESFTQGNLIRIGKAAKIIGVSICTLRRWEKAGLLPVAFKSAKGTRYYSRQLINKMTKTYVEDSALAPVTVGQTKPADKPIAPSQASPAQSRTLPTMSAPMSIAPDTSVKDIFRLGPEGQVPRAAARPIVKPPDKPDVAKLLGLA